MFQKCSGAATEDGVIVSFAGRDKTSSSELGVGIKVNLHTPRICEENVPRDGYGNTCLVHARRDVTLDFASSLLGLAMLVRARRVAMSDFVSSLTWRCLVHAWRDATSDFAWRCLVRERRVAMSDFASSLTRR